MGDHHKGLVEALLAEEMEADKANSRDHLTWCRIIDCRTCNWHKQRLNDIAEMEK